MVFFNYATMQMAAKIVYYGPGLCGKTTNLQCIYQKTSPKSRGEMVSLETETDRTLFFDLLPLDVGNIAGFKTRFQLYTVPGQVFYNSTRKLVLRGVDGIVFVADSQIPMMETNVESLGNLKANLAELGLNIDEIPLVFQYNKRDLKSIATVEELNRKLNPRNLPHFEASALQGNGVFETLKGISKATLITLRRRALGEERLKVPEVASKPGIEKPRVATPVPPSATVPRTPTPVPHPAPAVTRSMTPPVAQETPIVSAEKISRPASEPVGSAPTTPTSIPRVAPAPTLAAIEEPRPAVAEAVAVPTPPLPTAAEIAKEKVEFAEVTTPVPKPTMKKIAVKTSDIASKLDALRDLYTGKSDSKKGKKEKVSALDELSALLDSTKGKERKISKKLKIRLEPSEMDVVKNLSMDFHLTGDSLHKRFSNALNVSVEGKTNPKRLVLEIRLEIIKK